MEIPTPVIPTSEIPTSDYLMPGLASWDREDSDEVRRLLVLDAANIINGTSADGCDRKRIPYKMLGLISLMRIFVKLRFDIIVGIPRKFFMKDVLDGRIVKAFWKLRKVDVIKMTAQNTLDDLDIIETAAATGGLVISQDQFRDHSADLRLAKIISTSAARVDYWKAAVDVVHRFSKDGHYIATNTFMLHTPEKYFTKPDDPRYELVKYTRQSWSEEKQQKIMAILDKIIEIVRPIEIKF